MRAVTCDTMFFLFVPYSGVLLLCALLTCHADRQPYKQPAPQLCSVSALFLSLLCFALLCSALLRSALLCADVAGVVAVVVRFVINSILTSVLL